MRIIVAITLFLCMSLPVRAQLRVRQPAGLFDSSKLFSEKFQSIFFTPVRFQNKLVKEIPKDIYTRNFGFFCKQELKMHQAHVPVSFRVGSFENCNYLEQKGCGVK